MCVFTCVCVCMGVFYVVTFMWCIRRLQIQTHLSEWNMFLFFSATVELLLKDSKPSEDLFNEISMTTKQKADLVCSTHNDISTNSFQIWFTVMVLPAGPADWAASPEFLGWEDHLVIFFVGSFPLNRDARQKLCRLIRELISPATQVAQGDASAACTLLPGRLGSRPASEVGPWCVSVTAL